MKLVRVLRESRIPRVPFEIYFSEGEGQGVVCSTILEENGIAHHAKIIFKIVAHVEIVSVNLHDYIDTSYLSAEECAGFYRIDNQEIQNLQLYDPNNRLNLKNYIVEGYDSHLNIVASRFEIIKGHVEYSP